MHPHHHLTSPPPPLVLLLHTVMIHSFLHLTPLQFKVIFHDDVLKGEAKRCVGVLLLDKLLTTAKKFFDWVILLVILFIPLSELLNPVLCHATEWRHSSAFVMQGHLWTS